MIGKKIQPYTYTQRTAATDDDSFGARRFFYITPPEDSLSIENINTHFVFQFNSLIPSQYRKIEKIGIVNTVSDDLYTGYSWKRYYEIDESADINRIVEVNLDLSALLKKDNVGYYNGGGGLSIPDDGTFITIDFPTEISDYIIPPDVDGETLIWKTDAMFTIKRIR